MKSVTVELDVRWDEPPSADHPRVVAAAARAAGIAAADVAAVVLRRRSLDARSRREPRWVLRADVFDRHEQPPDLRLPPAIRPQRLGRAHADLAPIIVGMGPAGLFAALRFADLGVRCTIVDRGAAVEQRNLHVRDLRARGELDAESNLCFGEGGAGTYSDGKLYTRGKSGRVREVYERLVALGMTPRILVDAHPHVGTNRLIPMAKVLREALREAGHQLLFDSRVEDLLISQESGARAVSGVRLADGTELVGGPVVFATGHSARDTYKMLAARGVAMVRKPFAVGARVEHAQELIDKVQFGALAGAPALGAAEYFVRTKVPTAAGERGVYSFCMCPGGFVMPSPTALHHLNVNGMSNSNRGSGRANAALVMQVLADDMYLDTPGDLDADPDFGAHVADGALLGIALQGALEKRAYDQGGGGYKAPAQRLTAFVGGELGAAPGKTTYRPGVTHADLSDVLPARIVAGLARAATRIDRGQLRGYLNEDATIMGVETTTSSPVRIVRGDDRQSITHPGLYPCAEGAGYAGGIVSSAIDGMLTAEAIAGAAGLAVTPADRR